MSERAVSLFCILSDVLAAHFVGSEDGDKGRGRGGFLYVRTAASFFALDQAHCASDYESEIAGGFDGLDGGGSGGAYVVDDHDARAFFAEAFEALSGAVLFFTFAYQKTVQFAADYRNGGDDGIGAHGEAADRGRLPVVPENFGEKNFAGKTRTLGIERGGAAVDVVVAGATGRKLEFAQAERLAGKQAEQLRTGVGFRFEAAGWHQSSTITREEGRLSGPRLRSRQP